LNLVNYFKWSDLKNISIRNNGTVVHKSNNKIVSEAAEKSAVPDNIVDKKNTDMQKKEFAYNGYVLSQREKKIFKHTSQEQQFKFDKHRDLIIKQRRDFAYKQSYKDKLDTRHTYYAELATKTAKEAYDRFKNQDEDAASESRNQSLGDMTNDQVRHTVNSVGNTAKNTAPAINSTTITEENPFILWLWAKKTLKTVSILRWLMLTAPESTSSSAPYMKKQAWHFLRPTITAASKNTSGQPSPWHFTEPFFSKTESRLISASVKTQKIPFSA